MVRFSTGPHPIHFYSTPRETPFTVHSSPSMRSLWPLLSIPEYLENTNLFYQYLLGLSPKLHAPMTILAEAFQSGTMVVCSDGSFNPTQGTDTHGWVIASMTRVPLSTGAGPMCRNPTLSSACRSELSGLVAILFLVTKICAYHQIESGKITLYCDNKGAIYNIFHHTYTGISQYLYTDSDLVICCKILAHPSSHHCGG